MDYIFDYHVIHFNIDLFKFVTKLLFDVSN